MQTIWNFGLETLDHLVVLFFFNLLEVCLIPNYISHIVIYCAMRSDCLCNLLMKTSPQCPTIINISFSELCRWRVFCFFCVCVFFCFFFVCFFLLKKLDFISQSTFRFTEKFSRKGRVLVYPRFSLQSVFH